MSREWDDLPPSPANRLDVRCSGLTADGPFTGFGAPHGDYSRMCWLPVLGPTAWVLWGTLARELPRRGSVAELDVNDLTKMLGLGRPSRLMKALGRLDRLGLAIGPGDGDQSSWDLVAMSPPLHPLHHSKMSAAGRRFHHQWIDDLSGCDRQMLWYQFMDTYDDHFGKNHYLQEGP